MKRSIPIGRHSRADGDRFFEGNQDGQLGISQNLVLFFVLILLSLTATSVRAEKLDPGLCRALVKHTPDADVAYQPGVDVHGNAVAPADLPNQPQMQLPQQIKIPLTLNLAKSLNLNTTSYPYNQLGAGTEAHLGDLTVDGDKVLFNGQPISDTQQDRLAVLCLQPR
jgi:hypothetical protein